MYLLSTACIDVLHIWNRIQQTVTALKKRSERSKHCALAEPKIFDPPQTPLPGTRDGQNLISWRSSLPLPTNPVWWGSMHAISSYRGNRPTNTQTHRQDRLQYTAPLSLARSVVTTFFATEYFTQSVGRPNIRIFDRTCQRSMVWYTRV